MCTRQVGCTCVSRAMPVVMGCCASAGALPASGAARRAGAEYHQHGAAPHGDGAGAAAAQQMGGAVCAILLGAHDTPRQCAGGGGLLAAKQYGLMSPLKEPVPQLSASGMHMCICVHHKDSTHSEHLRVHRKSHSVATVSTAKAAEVSLPMT